MPTVKYRKLGVTKRHFPGPGCLLRECYFYFPTAPTNGHADVTMDRRLRGERHFVASALYRHCHSYTTVCDTNTDVVGCNEFPVGANSQQDVLIRLLPFGSTTVINEE